MKKDLIIMGSEIAGKGVFANRNFNAKEMVFQPYGRVIDGRKIDWDSISHKDAMFYLQVSPWKYLEPKDPRLRCLNHSCDPNMGYKSIDGKVSFVSIKPIRRGEEVNFDYSTTMLEEWDEAQSSLNDCSCASKNCRGKITDFLNIPKTYQERYMKLGVVPDYILKRLKK